MTSQTSNEKARWQFSLRASLVAVAVLSVCLSIATIVGRRAAEQTFILRSVVPIVDSFVSSVGYSNGRIVWLRVNDIDPHNTNFHSGYSLEELDGFVSQWEVPISMSMLINDGSFGPYKTFGDEELERLVAEHRHIRALDLRHSAVTDSGLSVLGELKRLEWLWLDSNQSTESGLSHLHELSSLRTLGLDVDSIDRESLAAFKGALDNCGIEDNADSSAARTPRAD